MMKIRNRLVRFNKLSLLISVSLALPLFAGAQTTTAVAKQHNDGTAASTATGSVTRTSSTQSTAAASATEQAATTAVERIRVYGRRWLPQTHTAEGSFTLNRDFIDNAMKGNGNITDMLLFLPGVQGAEDALDISQQAEIRSKLISISGAQPWQTAFILNGISNNSLLDPGSAGRSVTAINDVQGHPEASFINQELIDSVTVYDSNIPARFGAFSGGVVDMQLREPAKKPSFSLNYRRSHSDWGSYRFLDLREYNPDAEASATEVNWPEAPDFSKETLSFTASTPLTKQQAVTFSLARTTSTITEVSLQDAVKTERESLSMALSYTLDDILFDRIRLNASHAPYTGSHLIRNVKDSAFDLKGGGQKFSMQLENSLWGGEWTANLAYSQSENSRTAPGVFLPWIRAKGKEWGIDSGQPPLSVEGGYGDLDKTQKNWLASMALTLPLGQHWGAEHQLEFGGTSQYLQVQRERPAATAIYSAAFRDSNINCMGQTLDCIEQRFAIPLEELAAQLGGSIDFANPMHVQAYQNNLRARGQFFRYRRVYLAENIDVGIQQADLYAEYSANWQRLELSLGLRADYDDFLENLNIAYRSRLSVDVFGNGRTRVHTGLNRYYGANLLTYKLREGQRPYITQYRLLNDGKVGNWVTSSAAQRFRYRFDDVKTPYNDEAVLGLKQRMFDNGLLSINYVYRQGLDQITRGPSQVINGITNLFQTNEGESEHQRISLTYSHVWQQHAITFNVNYTENTSSAESYDNTVQDVPEDELVVLQDLSGRYRLVSYDDLTRRQLDFSRPLTANLVWNAQWGQRLSTTLTTSYVSKFDSVIDMSRQFETTRDDIELCAQCNINQFTYALFREIEKPARLMFGARLAYDMPLTQDLDLGINVEISNLFNQRTYSVSQGTAGIEVGREFWLGVSLKW